MLKFLSKMSYQALVVLALFLSVTISTSQSDSFQRVTSFESGSGSGSSAAATTVSSTSKTDSSPIRSDAAAAVVAEANAAAVAPPPPVVHPPIVPPIAAPLPLGAGAGVGFHKNIDFSAGKGIGLLPFLQGMIPGLGAGVGAVPPPVAPLPPPVGAGPIGADPGLLGGLGGGYLGLPGFLGPSYIPQTWIGSALGAKGDLWFPVVIFIFAVVGVWAVAQFLLGLIVPLIAGKLLVTKAVVAKKMLRGVDEDAPENHQAMVDDLTHKVMAAIDKKYEDRDQQQQQQQQHKPLQHQPLQQHQHIPQQVGSTNDPAKVSSNNSDPHQHPLLSVFTK